jgi:hypothetical protein
VQAAPKRCLSTPRTSSQGRRRTAGHTRRLLRRPCRQSRRWQTARPCWKAPPGSVHPCHPCHPDLPEPSTGGWPPTPSSGSPMTCGATPNCWPDGRSIGRPAGREGRQGWWTGSGITRQSDEGAAVGGGWMGVSPSSSDQSGWPFHGTSSTFNTQSLTRRPTTQPWQQPPMNALAITDDRHRRALPSTRHCPRTAIHLGCSIRLAVGGRARHPVLDGIGPYSGGITVCDAAICFR